jgi:protoporphyrinogen oxidase
MIATGARVEPRLGGAERVGIVGGGILGMAIANKLAQRGASVTIIEAAPSLGGLASAWSLGDFTWDRHYHVTLYSDRRLRALLRELGLEDELQWSTPATGFFTDARMHPMNNLVDFMRFPALDVVAKLRLGATILYASRIRDGLPLERIPVTTWLSRLSGKRTLEKIWRPLLRAKLGDRHVEASASFIWAIIVRLYAARSSGLGRERFGYVPGGYARILERLADSLRARGVETLLNAPVARVGREGTSGVTVSLRDGRALHFDTVVMTLPAPRAAQVCPELSGGELDWLRSRQYQGIVCASVVLDEPLGPYYITNITDGSVPFSAVIDMSAVVDREQFRGKALVYLPKYVAPDDPLFERTDDEIRAEFLAGLARMYAGFSEARVKAFRVSRVREVFPIPTLRYSEGLPSIVTSIPGLYLANSAHIVNGTLNVNETLQLADRALAAMEIHAAVH